jgi:hypothetical protein
MRKKQKKVPTEYAIKLVLESLEVLRNTGQDVKAVLNKSTAMAWIDVFPIRGDDRRTTPRQTGAAGDKFTFGDVDRSGDKLAQQQTMERHNIIIPEGDIEL